MNSSDSINDLINYKHLKDTLQEKIERRAKELVALKSFEKKSIHNKTSNMRTQKLVRDISVSNFDRQVEEIRKQKAEKNDISFSQIEKNHFLIKKGSLLPEIANLNRSALGGEYDRDVPFI